LIIDIHLSNVLNTLQILFTIYIYIFNGIKKQLIYFNNALFFFSSHYFLEYKTDRQAVKDYKPAIQLNKISNSNKFHDKSGTQHRHTNKMN